MQVKQNAKRCGCNVDEIDWERRSCIDKLEWEQEEEEEEEEEGEGEGEGERVGEKYSALARG